VRVWKLERLPRRRIPKLNELAFELYKEVLSVVNLAAHLLDDQAAAKRGWVRNQAVCGGLIIRISKFMLVVTQLSATRNRAEVVHALNRSILESATNLEFQATKNDAQCFEQFVKFSLGPERELYDLIQKNIAKRGGEPQPIEKRMLESIDRVCSKSGTVKKSIKNTATGAVVCANASKPSAKRSTVSQSSEYPPTLCMEPGSI
jgi:hypothetical protein